MGHVNVVDYDSARGQNEKVRVNHEQKNYIHHYLSYVAY